MTTEERRHDDNDDNDDAPAMTGDADTIDRYDRALDRLVRFHPEAVDLATELVGEDGSGADGPRPDRLPAPDEHRPRRPGDGARWPTRR